jgi:cyclic-di-GMP-binding protein
MPSFDVVSEVNLHEVQNAFDQAERELETRFDFRGAGVKLERTEKGFSIVANSEDRAKAAGEVLREKFVRRRLSLKFLDYKKAEPAGGQKWRINIEMKQGVDKDSAKKLVQMIKESKSLKVTPSIQGESVRVTGKNRDDLQEVIASLREKEFPIELSFNNFRD